jgi:hypothetical protein
VYSYCKKKAQHLAEKRPSTHSHGPSDQVEESFGPAVHWSNPFENTGKLQPRRNYMYSMTLRSKYLHLQIYRYGCNLPALQRPATRVDEETRTPCGDRLTPVETAFRDAMRRLP